LDGTLLVVVDGGAGGRGRGYLVGHICRQVRDEESYSLDGAVDATLSDWADRTHAQGGTVVAAHFPNPNGEPAVLVATGCAAGPAA
jgi:hypothetical protein